LGQPASGTRPTTCGVLVTDGELLLIGQATASPRWDIPKGMAEPGESWLEAAARELREETGLVAEPGNLVSLGVHRYLPAKQLALFAWRPSAMPDPAALRCSSMFRNRDGRMVPEFARFAALPWPEALARLGKNMARVLGAVRQDSG
jgi:8-oxo-dGTP pyrophosphatase MutT (NUDIX family)